KDLGETSVPCIVSEGYAADKAAHQSYVLNTERNQLNEIDIALHVRNMRDKFGYSFKDLEIKGYGSPTQLSKKVKLLELPEEVQKQIIKGELTVTHGLALLELGTETERKNMAKRASDQEWSAKATEKAVAKYKDKGQTLKTVKEVRKTAENLSGVNIYYQDSKDMSALADGSVDLIFTSPPCFAGIEYKNYTFNDHLNNIEGVMTESARVLAQGGIIALNITDIYDFKGGRSSNKAAHIELMAHRYQSVLKTHGVILEDQIIWVKEEPSRVELDETSSGKDRIRNQHEFIHIFRKNGERKASSEEAASALTKDERHQYFRSVWKIPPVKKIEGHPAVAPDELALRIIKMYSFKGDTVLDPFLGSGTTVKVAQELGRQAIGYEREAKYREIIEQKIASTNTQPQKFEAVSEFAKRQLEELENNPLQKTRDLTKSLQALQNKFSLAKSEVDMQSIETETNLQENAAA
ncbi:MAG: hypothetical protein HQK62_09785, partial [Desulfamplus sp.]|nr:hypothetical protein [Desulfamplus sp.]